MVDVLAHSGGTHAYLKSACSRVIAKVYGLYERVLASIQHNLTVMGR
jgi:hypothetical protein